MINVQWVSEIAIVSHFGVVVSIGGSPRPYTNMNMHIYSFIGIFSELAQLIYIVFTQTT